MNDKITRHIQDTINTLHLSKSYAAYLKNCMEIAYVLGQKDQREEDHKNEMQRIKDMFKK